MSINGRIDRQNVVYPCNGILDSNEKELTTEICYDMNEPQKQDAQ